MCDVFSVTYHVPKLKKEDAKKVMKYSDVLIDLLILCCMIMSRCLRLVSWALGRSYRDVFMNRIGSSSQVLHGLNVFNEGDIDAAAEALDDVKFSPNFLPQESRHLGQTLMVFLMTQMPLKKLYTLVEMAAQGRTGGSAEAIYAGKEKIDIDHFFSILGDIIRY